MGASQTAIYDLQREKNIFIPNDLSSSLLKHSGSKIDSVYKDFPATDKATLDHYFELLVFEDIIFVSPKPIDKSLFPNIDFSAIPINGFTNVILSFEQKDDIEKFEKAISEKILTIGVKYIQLRFAKLMPITIIERVLNCFSNSSVKHISLVIDHSDFIKIAPVTFLSKYLRIVSVILFNYSEELTSFDESELDHIEFIKFKGGDFPNLLELNDLRLISLNPNIVRYSEAQNYNTYYRGKMYIASDGYIYNSPQSFEALGNIYNSDLSELYSHSEMKKFWNITKDEIEVCKDCEFRYSCVDGRIPKVRSENLYYFETECKYNPYTNELTN